MDGSGPAAVSEPSEVKWQVAFFALVPLALGTMTQPVGRVFDRPPEERFWIRLSPLHCAADMLLFWGVLLARYVTQPERSWRHYRNELTHRFRDENDNVVQPRHDAERSALGRWTLVFLGGVPCQTIKLLAMRGIPFTQAAALMFFVSLVLGEVLILSAARLGRSDEAVNMEPLHARRPRSRLKHLVLVVMLHTVCDVSHTFLDIFICIVAALGHWLWFSIIYALSITAPLVLILVLYDRNGSLLRAKIGLLTLCPFVFNTFIILITQMAFHMVNHHSYAVVVGIMVGYFALICCWFSFSILVVFVVLEGPRWITDSSLASFLGVPGTAYGRMLVVFFFVHAVCAVLGYALAFDSSGSFNPSWTGIFG